MDSDGSVLAELFLGLVNLTDEVNETLTGLRDALLRPVREVELSDSSRLTVLDTEQSTASRIYHHQHHHFDYITSGRSEEVTWSSSN